MLSVRIYRFMNTRGKFGEHERSVGEFEAQLKTTLAS